MSAGQCPVSGWCRTIFASMHSKTGPLSMIKCCCTVQWICWLVVIFARREKVHQITAAQSDGRNQHWWGYMGVAESLHPEFSNNRSLRCVPPFYTKNTSHEGLSFLREMKASCGRIFITLSSISSFSAKSSILRFMMSIQLEFASLWDFSTALDINVSWSFIEIL